MGSTSFLGLSCPNLLLVFLNLLFLGTTYYIFFCKCWDFLWVLLLFFSVLYSGLARFMTTEMHCLALKSKKERYVLDRGQNGF